ncbi:MAG TPA: V-type ATPase 116kDa subunit family protein, partial [Pseudonocardiaceae bacterium]
EVGGSVVRLPAPRGIDPPTLLRDDNTVRRSFTPLVRTYGTVPYRDLDPTVPSALAYVLMFGMMFGDAGHGLLVLILAALLWSGRVRWLARWRSIWPFVAGAGATSTIFGVLYGEFFGPTGVIPVLWLSPLDQPVPLLAAGIGVGAVLLAVAYGIGVYNRWREGGLAMALYSSSGVAGTALFLGFGAVAAGIYLHGPVWMIAGVLLVVAGLGLATIGLAAESPGGGSGAMTVVIGLLDLIIRLGSNVVSFARLAAFGLTHAALAMLFWRGTVALAPHGPLGVISAAVLFILGTAVACSLEALVAGVQAMRLEYYELFSRVFETEGRPFQPWHVPLARPAGEESTR